jgi:hypothetical protein
MTSLSSPRPEEHVKGQVPWTGKNRSKCKAQEAKPQQRLQLLRKVLLGVILLRFALCVLPFDLFFQPCFCLLHFALCLLTFSSVL